MPATTTTTTKKSANMSDEAVKRATGKTWPQWIKALDAAGCRKMNHKQIVDVVEKKFSVGPWWGQMVTVGYERETGLRAKHQKPDGYEVSVSRTINCSAKSIYDSWAKQAARARWLDDGGNGGMEITTSTPAKSIRCKCGDGSRFSATLYPKADGRKCQITVQHGKLKGAKDVGRVRSFWKGAIDKLQTIIEK